MFAEAWRQPATWIVGTAVAGLAIGAAGVEPDLTIAAAGAAAAAAVALVFLGGRAARAEAAEKRAAQVIAAFQSDRLARLAVDKGGDLFRNEAADSLFGPAHNPLGPIEARMAGDDRGAAEMARLKAAAAQGGVCRGEVALASADGAREWLSVSVQPISGRGLPAGAVLWTAEDITARRAIEETLHAQHEMLADFLDFLPVGCYSADTENRFRYVNQRLAEWLGQPADHLVGQEIKAVLGAVPNPEEERVDMRLTGRNGDIFQAFVSHTVFDEGGETLTRSVVVRDLMPERHWERALKSAERRFRWLFDDAPVGIALVEPDGSIASCNLALQAMMGLDADDLVGRLIIDYMAEDNRAEAVDEFSKVILGSNLGAHLDVRLKAKRDIIASLFVSPTHEEGEITGLVIHFIDSTEQKNLEIQFAQSQKMQAMGQLAGGVAHDFNNLLTAMIGFSDLLLQRHGAGDPSFADIMQIKQNANRAASLVRQLLAFSRRQALQPRLLNVTDALADLSGLLRRLLGETIELKMVHGRDLGLVRVDPGQFDQVIINLAVNARDAMPGGGALTIRTAPVTVDQPVQRGPELMPAGDYILIEVTDTGTGISRENISRIFEPFFSTKEVGAGTGLGLSTVYGILRQTDGFIFVESAPGNGTTFTIHLPRTDGEAAERPKAAAAEAVGDLTGAGTILLVEDEDAVRLFSSRALRNKGYRVIEARSGEQALDVLRGDEAIDVLISDVVMPGMDGVTLARLVRMERPAIRIILISGYSEDVAKGDLAADEGIHFLPKPFSLKQLAGAVKEVTTGLSETENEE